MQEVETDLFDGPIRHSLERLGYGVALAVEQNWQKEALAYHLARFSLVTQRSFLMHELIEKALRRWLNTVCTCTCTCSAIDEQAMNSLIVSHA